MKATYAWEPSEDPIEKDNETILEVAAKMNPNVHTNWLAIHCMSS